LALRVGRARDGGMADNPTTYEQFAAERSAATPAEVLAEVERGTMTGASWGWAYRLWQEKLATRRAAAQAAVDAALAAGGFTEFTALLRGGE